MRWIVYAPQLLAVGLLVLAAVSANQTYPLLATEKDLTSVSYVVGLVLWYTLLLVALAAARAVLPAVVPAALSARAAIAGGLTALLLVASASTSSTGGFLTMRNDAVFVLIPGILVVQLATKAQLRSTASLDAPRRDAAAWGRRGAGFRFVGQARFTHDGRVFATVADAVPERESLVSAVALDPDGNLDRAFARAARGDASGQLLVAGERVVLVRIARGSIGVRVLGRDGREDIAATATLGEALAALGATAVQGDPPDAAGRHALVEAGAGRVAIVDLASPAFAARVVAVPAGFDAHAERGGAVVSAATQGERFLSIDALARERLRSSDDTPLTIRIPPELHPGAGAEAVLTGVFPWDARTVLVGVQLRGPGRTTNVLAPAAPAGVETPPFGIELDGEPARVVRLDDGGVAIEQAPQAGGVRRLTFAPGAGVHRLGARSTSDLGGPRVVRQGPRTTWTLPARVYALSRHGEALTCRRGVPILVDREGSIAVYDPVLPFGCG